MLYPTSVAWDVTFLIVHLLASYAFAKLYDRAPCPMAPSLWWIQKTAIFGWMLSMLVMASGFALKIHHVDGYIYVIWLAFAMEHLASLLYAFRLVYKEHLCLPNGLRPSPRSSRY